MFSSQQPADPSRAPVYLPGLFAALCLTLITAAVIAQPSAVVDQEPSAALSEDIQSLKQLTLELNRDLFILEEELLYPGDTRVSVFLSLDVGEFFALDAVKLSIDGRVVTHYLYTDRQLDALQRGGVHRLYMGNVKRGAHELVAVFTGRGPQGRDYRRGTTLQLQKDTGASNLELRIIDSTATHQPEFQVKQW